MLVAMLFAGLSAPALPQRGSAAKREFIIIQVPIFVQSVPLAIESICNPPLGGTATGRAAGRHILQMLTCSRAAAVSPRPVERLPQPPLPPSLPQQRVREVHAPAAGTQGTAWTVKTGKRQARAGVRFELADTLRKQAALEWRLRRERLCRLLRRASAARLQRWYRSLVQARRARRQTSSLAAICIRTALAKAAPAVQHGAMAQVSCGAHGGEEETDDLLIERAIQRADEERKQLERERGRVTDILGKVCARKGVPCPKRHPLKPMYIANTFCDLCGKQSEVAVAMAHCAACHFDLCLQCCLGYAGGEREPGLYQEVEQSLCKERGFKGTPTTATARSPGT